jgi:hypothetical protein
VKTAIARALMFRVATQAKAEKDIQRAEGLPVAADANI